MNLGFSSAKLTTNPDSSGWVQVLEFTPENPEKKISRGTLVALICSKNSEEGQNASLTSDYGREILTRLHEEYYGNNEGAAFNTLKTAVERVFKEFVGEAGSVEIAASVYIDETIYLAAAGGAEASILRDGALAKLLVSTPVSAISASGYPEEKDILILGTSSFYKFVSSGIIKAACQQPGLPETIEFLAPSVHLKDQAGATGAVFVKFGESGIQNPSFYNKVSTGSGVSEKLRKPLYSLLLLISRFFSKLLSEKKIYVKERTNSLDIYSSPQKKVMMSVGIILLVILALSIFFGVRQKNINEERNRYEDKLTQAQHEFDESILLVDLSPERARELFASSKSITQELVKAEIKDERLTELVAKISENEGKILGQYNIEPELFLDLSILSDGFEGKILDSSGEIIFILDSSGSKIAQVEISSKKSKIVAGPSEIEGASLLAAYEDRAFVLTGSGIFEIDGAKKEAITKDWEGEILFAAYAGNLYLIDKSQNLIWRYPGTASGFSQKQEWLSKDTAFNFSGAITVAIDGAIWILESNGDLAKFSLGRQENYYISGVAPELSSPNSIYTNDTLGFLYILDPSNKRVVVMDKEGKFIAQYVSDKIESVDDIVISEKEKKIILLSGSKLYSIEIKHL